MYFEEEGTMTEVSSDILHKFHFVNAPVRGIWVRLEKVWHDACHYGDYPRPVQDLLGQMLAVTALVANNVKQEPAVVLQAVGSGPVKLAFSECREHRFLRAIARIDEDHPETIFGKHSFRELMGEGKLAISIRLKNGSTYQGLVSMDSKSLLINLENYFKNSEQLETKLKVVCDESVVTGCLLQLLPSQNVKDEERLAFDNLSWHRITRSFIEAPKEDLIEQGIADFLRRRYPRHSIYLDDPDDLVFKCTCSYERSEAAVRALSEEEVEELLAEDGAVNINCEFCGKAYQFDRFSLDSVLTKGIN